MDYVVPIERTGLSFEKKYLKYSRGCYFNLTIIKSCTIVGFINIQILCKTRYVTQIEEMVRFFYKEKV